MKLILRLWKRDWVLILGALTINAFAVAYTFCFLLCRVEAQTVYNPQPNVVTNGLVGYWRLDAGSGVSAVDSSGYGNNAFLTNSPVWTNGLIGPAAMYFNGSGFIASAQNPLFNVSATNVSIAFWANIKSTTFAGTLTFPADDSNGGAALPNRGFICIADDRGVGDGYVRSNGLAFWFATAGSATNTMASIYTNAFDAGGGWHHFTATYNGSVINIYKDAASVNDTVSSTMNQPGNFVPRNTNFVIGALQSGILPITGFLDDFRIYNRALTAAEVTQLFNFRNAAFNTNGTTVYRP